MKKKKHVGNQYRSDADFISVVDDFFNQQNEQSFFEQSDKAGAPSSNVAIMLI